MKRKVGDAGVEELRPGEPPAKINSRWTNDELLMAVTAVRKYGEYVLYEILLERSIDCLQRQAIDSLARFCNWQLITSSQTIYRTDASRREEHWVVINRSWAFFKSTKS